MEAVNKACEPVQMKRIEEVLDTLRFLNDNVSGLRNRIHSACERVGVQFDPSEDTKEAPPSYGSINQVGDEISKIGRINDECHKLLNELERFV